MIYKIKKSGTCTTTHNLNFEDITKTIMEFLRPRITSLGEICDTIYDDTDGGVYTCDDTMLYDALLESTPSLMESPSLPPSDGEDTAQFDFLEDDAEESQPNFQGSVTNLYIDTPQSNQGLSNLPFDKIISDVFFPQTMKSSDEKLKPQRMKSKKRKRHKSKKNATRADSLDIRMFETNLKNAHHPHEHIAPLNVQQHISKLDWTRAQFNAVLRIF